MIFFKNTHGDVFAYETEQEREQYGASDLVAMTPEEIEAHLNQAVAPPIREQVEALRLTAYAHPVTGSDRYFAEAARLEIAGESEAAEEARQRGMVRHQEIKEQHPW